MKLKQIFVIAIIAMFLLVPFASAKQEVADNGNMKKDKKIDEKVTDKTKEVAKEITSKDKDIKGKVTVTDSDSSKYTVEKKSKTEISISKDEVKGEHTKSKVTFTRSDLQKIDVDGDQLYGVLHIADDGSTVHDVYTESQLTSGTDMIFSENIVNGYSGYWEGTYTGVPSGTTLDTPDVAASQRVTYSIDGSIPTHTAIDENNASSYPSGAQVIIPFNENSNSLINSVTGTDTNVSYSDGYAHYNGIDSRTAYSNNNYFNISANKTIHMRFKMNAAPSVTSWLIGKYAGGANTAGWFIYSYSDGKLRIVSATTVSSSEVYYITSSSYADSKVHDLAVTFDTVNRVMKVYMDGKYLGQDTWTGTLINIAQTEYIGSYSGGAGYYLNCGIYHTGIYNGILSNSSIRTLTTGGSGIAIRPVGYDTYTSYNVSPGTEKTISSSQAFNGLYYLDSSSGTHNVTIRIYFTEDVTKITETKDTVYQNVSIIHTKQNATASVGTIAYELDPLYSGDPVLTSNNTNATVSRNDTHVIISTGLVKQGQSFSYAVSDADDHDHGMWLNIPMKWVGTGWDFVSTAPDDWTNYIGDYIQVSVS